MRYNKLAEVLRYSVNFSPDLELWWSRLNLTPDEISRVEAAVSTWPGMDRTEKLWRVALDLHSHAAWGHAGFNDFNLTHGLVAALLLTDSDPVVPFFPFDAFNIRIPPGAFVVGGGFVRRIMVNCYVRRGTKRVALTVETDHDGRFGGDQFDLALDGLDAACANERVDSLRGPVLRLVRGICSFIETRVEALTPDNARAIERTPPGESTARVFTVGRTVKICRELREIAARLDGPPLWKLEHRLVVRGHWRNQACGPGLSERKKIRIAPYWKGPEGAEAWRHLYEVSE